MKKYIFVAILFGIFGCDSNETGPNITYLNPALKKTVQATIDLTSTKSDKTIFTIYIQKSEDTLLFEIYDAAPNTSPERFMGYTMLGKHPVCFIADSVYTAYFKIDRKTEIPPDIVDEAKNDPAFFSEPRVFYSVTPTTISPITNNIK